LIFNFIVVFESFDDDDGGAEGGAGGVGGGGGGGGPTGVDVLLFVALSVVELDSETCPSSPSYKLLFSLLSFC